MRADAYDIDIDHDHSFSSLIIIGIRVFDEKLLYLHCMHAQSISMRSRLAAVESAASADELVAAAVMAEEGEGEAKVLEAAAEVVGTCALASADDGATTAVVISLGCFLLD